MASRVFHCPVALAKTICGQREFEEWKMYKNLWPFGDDWLQTGVISATTRNTWSKQRAKPEDFIPKASKPQTVEQQQHLFKTFGAALQSARGNKRKTKQAKPVRS